MFLFLKCLDNLSQFFNLDGFSYTYIFMWFFYSDELINRTQHRHERAQIRPDWPISFYGVQCVGGCRE